MNEQQLELPLDNAKRYGWAEFHEDWNFLARATVQSFSAPHGFVPPEAMSFRSILHVEDQKQMGSCVGHGSSSGMECLEFLSNGGVVQLSRMFAYIEAQKASGIRGDNGAAISGAIQFMTNIGCCFESEYPYPTHYQTTVTQAQLASAAAKKILGHQPLNSAQEVFDWISQGKGPVIIGFSVTQAYENLHGTGSVVTPAILNGRSLGGHCVLFAGYSGATDSAGKKMIDQIGSWNTTWGDKGWAPWTWAAIDLMCKNERGQSSVFGITNITGFDQARVDRVVAWSEVM